MKLTADFKPEAQVAAARALAALNGTDIVYINDESCQLKVFHYYYALSKPWRYPFTGE